MPCFALSIYGYDSRGICSSWAQSMKRQRFRLVVAGRRNDSLDYTVRFSYAYPVSVWGTLNGQGRAQRRGSRHTSGSSSHLVGP